MLKKYANYLKRGKTPVTKLQLVLVLCVIGWEGGTSFVDQSRNETSEKLDYIEPALLCCKQVKTSIS